MSNRRPLEPLKELQNLVENSDNHDHDEKVLEKAEELSEIIRRQLDMEGTKMDSGDANAVAYVAGALIRSELNMRKCGSCSGLLKQDGALPPISLHGFDHIGQEFEITPDVAQLMNRMSRGGLLAPSILAFSIGLKCWDVFKSIDVSKELQSEFLKCENQQLLFVSIVEGLLEEDCDLEEIAIPRLKCDLSHPFGKSLIRRFFNCFTKNWVKRLSGDGTSGQSMKITKLCGQW